MKCSSHIQAPPFLGVYKRIFLLEPAADPAHACPPLNVLKLVHWKVSSHINGFKCCCNGITYVLERCHSICAVIWNICYAHTTRSQVCKISHLALGYASQHSPAIGEFLTYISVYHYDTIARFTYIVLNSLCRFDAR